jgi:hypothetical protein
MESVYHIVAIRVNESSWAHVWRLRFRYLRTGYHGVEGWLWVGWVVSFGGFDCCFLFMVGGARNKLESTLLTLILTPLKRNTQSVCGLGCTLLNPTQILLDHFLTQSSFIKTCSQVGNLLLKLGVLFGSMEKLTLERKTCFTRRG